MFAVNHAAQTATVTLANGIVTTISRAQLTAIYAAASQALTELECRYAIGAWVKAVRGVHAGRDGLVVGVCKEYFNGAEDGRYVTVNSFPEEFEVHESDLETATGS